MLETSEQIREQMLQGTLSKVEYESKLRFALAREKRAREAEAAKGHAIPAHVRAENLRRAEEARELRPRFMRPTAPQGAVEIKAAKSSREEEEARQAAIAAFGGARNLNDPAAVKPSEVKRSESRIQAGLQSREKPVKLPPTAHAILRDVDAREQRQRRIVDLTPQASIIVDPTGRVHRIDPMDDPMYRPPMIVAAPLPMEANYEETRTGPDAIATAMQSARDLPGGRVDVRELRVARRKIGKKDRMRVDPPDVPTWYLYRDGVTIALPHDWPNRAPIGVTLYQARAAKVCAMIQAEEISAAVYAEPAGSDGFSVQEKHIPMVDKAAIQVAPNGLAVETREVFGHEYVETSPDREKFQVIVWLVTPAGVCQSETYSSTEARARACVMEGFENGAIRAHIHAMEGKLSPEAYPIVLDGRPVWKFSDTDAEISRSAWARMQKTPPSDEAKPLWKRGGPVCWTRKTSERPSQRARDDKFHFSHG